jgi:hypothetical protein
METIVSQAMDLAKIPQYQRKIRTCVLDPIMDHCRRRLAWPFWVIVGLLVCILITNLYIVLRLVLPWFPHMQRGLPLFSSMRLSPTMVRTI